MNTLTKYFLSFAHILLICIVHRNSAMNYSSDDFNNLSPHIIQTWSLTEIRNFLRQAQDFQISEIIEPIMQRTAEEIASNTQELTNYINFPHEYTRSLSLSELQKPNKSIKYLLIEKLLNTAPLKMKQERMYKFPHHWTITKESNHWTIKKPLSLAEVIILHAAHNIKVNFKNTNLALSIIFNSLLKKIQPDFSLEYKVAKAFIAYDPNFAQTNINYAKQIKDNC